MRIPRSVLLEGSNPGVLCQDLLSKFSLQSHEPVEGKQLESLFPIFEKLERILDFNLLQWRSRSQHQLCGTS